MARMTGGTGRTAGDTRQRGTGQRDTRQRMVVAAAQLLRERGYDGTGCRDVVARARAARGAIYHHFPGGKTEIGIEAARWAGGLVTERVERACAEAHPREGVRAVLELADRLLIRADGPAGCPVAAVTLSAEDPDGALRAAANEIFGRWRAAIAGCLARAGVDAQRAARFAAVTVAGIEGTVLLCRASGDVEPYQAVRAGLLDQLDLLLGSLPGPAEPETGL